MSRLPLVANLGPAGNVHGECDGPAGHGHVRVANGKPPINLSCIKEHDPVVLGQRGIKGIFGPRTADNLVANSVFMSGCNSGGLPAWGSCCCDLERAQEGGGVSDGALRGISPSRRPAGLPLRTPAPTASRCNGSVPSPGSTAASLLNPHPASAKPILFATCKMCSTRQASENQVSGKGNGFVDSSVGFVERDFRALLGPCSTLQATTRGSPSVLLIPLTPTPGPLRHVKSSSPPGQGQHATVDEWQCCFAIQGIQLLVQMHSTSQHIVNHRKALWAACGLTRSIPSPPLHFECHVRQPAPCPLVLRVSLLLHFVPIFIPAFITVRMLSQIVRNSSRIALGRQHIDASAMATFSYDT
jgi:hypothetical protein